jgi:hypothetical protein
MCHDRAGEGRPAVELYTAWLGRHYAAHRDGGEAQRQLLRKVLARVESWRAAIDAAPSAPPQQTVERADAVRAQAAAERGRRAAAEREARAHGDLLAILFRAGFTLYMVTIIEIYSVKPVRWRTYYGSRGSTRRLA